MNNTLRYLQKLDLDKELDNILNLWMILASYYDNKKCSKCGTTQGILNFGVKKYYCQHITDLIDNKLKKEKKEITKKIFAFTMYQDNQNNP